MPVTNFSIQNSIRVLFALSLVSVLSACGGGGAQTLGVIDDYQPVETETTGDAGISQVRNLVIVGQPGDVAVAAGQNHTFTVNVDHTHPVTVKWYKNDSLVNSSNTSSFGLSPVDESSAGEYNCVVTDGVMTVNCKGFELSVIASQEITITDQPDNQMVSEGMNVELDVNAKGSEEFSYQWYFDGQAIAGATSRKLALSGVSSAAEGEYYVVVTGSGSSAQSDNARLTVAVTAARATALIQWDKPTKRENGSALDAEEIAGYEIFYGESAEGDMESLASLDAESQSYLAKDLTQGTHYFALQTVDGSGLKSERSAPLVVTIN